MHLRKSLRQSLILGWVWTQDRVLAAQPQAPKPTKAPLRDLQFGDINFLHTTDTHGWHAGHLSEPSYSADWGDYIDLSDRLREQLEAAGQDLLLVDTGDRIEGNGLYDGDEPKGRRTFEIFTKQHMDIICVGNHELYKQNSSENELNITVPAYHESYIASNLDILNSTGSWIPLAQRYRKFKTRVRGTRVMAFGFIFNFQRNDKNTRITTVEDTIEQDWFKEAILDRDVDLFVVIGHVEMQSDEFLHIFRAIRSANWYAPIQFFGGHYHIRDARKFDARAYGLASGRFMETIGFQSITGVEGTKAPSPVATTPTFFRRYIDNNLFSFYHHTGLNSSTFHSAKGRKVSKLIQTARHELKLDSVFGCVPQTYWMQSVPFPSKTSVFTLLNDTVIPEIVIEPGRKNISRLILVNTGAIRFDIFKGQFTKDSTFIVSPFTSGMHYLPDVPYDIAVQLLPLLNSGKKPTILQSHGRLNHLEQDATARYLAPPEQYSRHFDHSEQLPWDKPINHFQNPTLHSSGTTHLTTNHDEDPNNPPLTPGYVTIDPLSSDGDDTIHTPIPIYKIPNVMQTFVPSDPSHLNLHPYPTSELTLDLIFNEFLQPDILGLLKVLKRDYTNNDVKAYMEDENMTDMVSRWIAENWKDNCSGDDNDNLRGSHGLDHDSFVDDEL